MCQNSNRFIYWLVFADTVFTWTVMILSFALIVFATVMRRRSENLETEMANLASLTAGGNTRGLSPRELARLRTFSFRMTDKLTQAERASKQGTLLRTLQRRAGGGRTPAASPALDEHDSERHGLRAAGGDDAKRDEEEMPPVTEIMIISEEEYARIDEEHKREAVAAAAATASGRSSTPEREKTNTPVEKQPKRINTGGSSKSAKLGQESPNQIVTETRFSPTFNRYPDPLWVSGGSSKSDGKDVPDLDRHRSLTADSSLTHVDKEESRSPSEGLPGASSSSNVMSSPVVEQDEAGKEREDGDSSVSNEAPTTDAPPATSDESGADAAARAIDSSYETCAICYCAYETGERLRELACGHVFHKECIDEWLRGDPETGIGGHRTCPLCVREAVRPEDRDAEWLGEVEGEEIDEEDPEVARRRRRRRRRDRSQRERETSEDVGEAPSQVDESAAIPSTSAVAERPSEVIASSSSAALQSRPHRRGNSAGPRASTSSMQTASSEEDVSGSRRTRWRRTWTFVGRRRNAEAVAEGSPAVRTPSFGVDSDSANAATSRSTPERQGSSEEILLQQHQQQNQQQQHPQQQHLQQQQRGSRILDSSIREEAEEENQEN
ncbi:hypothetical protein BJ742DRAFT_145523 [Cladochytrium replicatum]|nr:hypothetical protein BJ742DRAFT_145523 [Cladochytrium replicatum]